MLLKNSYVTIARTIVQWIFSIPSRPRVEITQYYCTRVRNMAEITIQCLAQKVNTRPETWWNDVLSSTRKRARCFPLSLFNAFIRPTKCPILIISERVARRVSLFRTERERERERENWRERKRPERIYLEYKHTRTFNSSYRTKSTDWPCVPS